MQRRGDPRPRAVRFEGIDLNSFENQQAHNFRYLVNVLSIVHDVFAKLEKAGAAVNAVEILNDFWNAGDTKSALKLHVNVDAAKDTEGTYIQDCEERFKVARPYRDDLERQLGADGLAAIRSIYDELVSVRRNIEAMLAQPPAAERGKTAILLKPDEIMNLFVEGRYHLNPANIISGTRFKGSRFITALKFYGDPLQQEIDQVLALRAKFDAVISPAATQR